MKTSTERLRESVNQRIDELERIRDEVKLKLHLANLDAKKHWFTLETQLDELESELRRDRSAVAEASSKLSEQLVTSFREFRNRLVEKR